MKLAENPSLNSIDWTRVVELFNNVNWKGRNELDVENSFSNSTFTCFIYEEDKIVGFGRTFDDGQYYGTICDLVIHEDYQGRGYGKQILNNLKERMTGYIFITLTAAPGKAPFYKKMGWESQNSAFIWPINKKQKKEHCD
jgi:GNAT superfamily N-acetyltransferase